MKLFKMNKWKRLSVMVATIVATILAIVLGSTLYVSKNVRKSVEYGGGAEYIVEVKPNGSQDAASIATDVAQSIYERINPLGVNGADAEAMINGNNADVRVVYPGTTTDKERENIEELITSKPQLVLSDFYGNPLFNKYGHFNPSLYGDPKGWATGQTEASLEDFYSYDPDHPKALETKVPIASGGAKETFVNDQHKVNITLSSNEAAAEWTKATRYISSLPKGKNTVLAWLDPHKLIYKLRNAYGSNVNPSFNQILSNAKNEAYGMIALTQVLNEKGVPTKVTTNFVPAENYIVSAAMVAKPLTGRQFVIEGKFTTASAQKLARRINYGVSDYSLKTKYSNVIEAEYGTSAFHKAMIAGIVVFSLIALILIVNYGLLGALSTISIALFVFMTLLMFTVMRGEYSPAAIAALIIGIGMSVDANIITFERLKAEVYAGASIKKGFKNSNRKSLSTIFDSNITTMIVAIVLFYFGTRSIIGLSVTLILSIIFTLLIMLLFTRFVATMLVNSGAFQNKKWLAGLKPKFDNKVQDKINKVDYIKSSKWFAFSSVGIAIVGLIVFSVFAGINSSFGAGFNLSQDFAGGASIVVESPHAFTATEITNIKSALHGVPLEDMDISSTIFKVRTTVDLDINVLKSTIEGISASHDFKVIVSNTTTDVAQQLVKDAIIAVSIAIGAIILYTLIRFKWTYSIAAIVALLHDAIIVMAIFIICRVEVSPIFVAALLSVIGYSINDTIVTFDRIREKANDHIGVLDKAGIKNLANDAIKDTLKRSIWTSLTTIVAVLVLMCFGNATKFSFNLAMLVGLISGTYSSIFIATYLWTKLELIRQKGINSRAKNNFWKTEGVEEQTIGGINDFKA